MFMKVLLTVALATSMIFGADAACTPVAGQTGQNSGLCNKIEPGETGANYCSRVGTGTLNNVPVGADQDNIFVTCATMDSTITDKTSFCETSCNYGTPAVLGTLDTFEIATTDTFAKDDVITGESTFTLAAAASGNFAGDEVITGESTFTLAAAADIFSPNEVITGESTFSSIESTNTFAKDDVITGESIFTLAAAASGNFAGDEVITGESTFSITTTTNNFAVDDVITGAAGATATVIGCSPNNCVSATSLEVYKITDGPFQANEVISSGTARGTFKVVSTPPKTATVVSRTDTTTLVMFGISAPFTSNEKFSSGVKTGTYASTTTATTAIVTRRVSATSLEVYKITDGPFQANEVISAGTTRGTFKVVTTPPKTATVKVRTDATQLVMFGISAPFTANEKFSSGAKTGTYTSTTTATTAIVTRRVSSTSLEVYKVTDGPFQTNEVITATPTNKKGTFSVVSTQPKTATVVSRTDATHLVMKGISALFTANEKFSSGAKTGTYASKQFVALSGTRGTNVIATPFTKTSEIPSGHYVKTSGVVGTLSNGKCTNGLQVVTEKAEQAVCGEGQTYHVANLVPGTIDGATGQIDAAGSSGCTATITGAAPAMSAVSLAAFGVAAMAVLQTV